MPYSTGANKLISLYAANQAPGNLTLSDVNSWGAINAVIVSIVVTTSSTNWRLYLCESSAFDITADTTILLVNNGLGNITADVRAPYFSNSANVYLKYIDDSGANNASLYIRGTRY